MTDTDKWTQEWPTEDGIYWFYSYRYGKISCGNKQKPELLLASKNGNMITANGQFVFENEPEEAYFMKCTPPELPKLD